MFDLNPMFGRESRLIGAVLFDGEYNADGYAMSRAIEADLEPGDFRDPQLGRIWQACLDESRDRGPARVDKVSVCERLHAEGDLERIGGPLSVVGLLSGVATGAHAQHDARLIRQRARVLEAAREGGAVLENAVNGMAEPDDIREWAERSMRAVAPLDHAPADSIARTLLDMADSPEDSVMTGFDVLDHGIGGFRRGSLVIVAGRPSCGKSALMLDLGRHAAHAGRRARFFSLEMTRREVASRVCAAEASIDALKVLSGADLGPDGPRFVRAHERIAAMDLNVQDGPLRFAEIARRVESEADHPDIVLVDYLQRVPVKHPERKHTEYGAITAGLKDMALGLNCVVVLGSQLTRGVARDGREPRLDDLAESGAIEADADIVLFLHWPDELAPRDRVLIVGKNRNGPKGRWDMRFWPELTTFAPVSS